MVGRTFYVRVCIIEIGKIRRIERSSRNFSKLEKGEYLLAYILLLLLLLLFLRHDITEYAIASVASIPIKL